MDTNALTSGPHTLILYSVILKPKSAIPAVFS